MSRMRSPSDSCSWRMSLQHYRLFLFVCLIFHVSASETYTDSACNAVVTTMNSCAARWDTIRVKCVESISTNTIWPGPCECSYYANDLPCFDEQALCAAQVWTQVPQWFRDGVTSCLMKDESYTIRAQLGSVDNPFLISGIAGNATRKTADASTTGASVTTPTAQTGNSVSAPTVSPTSISTLDQSFSSTTGPANGLSTGAKAGLGVGVGVGVGVLMAIAAVVWLARRRRTGASKNDTGGESGRAELDDKDTEIHEAGFLSVHPKHELDGNQRNELGGNPRNEIAGNPRNELGGIPRNELDGMSQQRHELDGNHQERYELEAPIYTGPKEKPT